MATTNALLGTARLNNFRLNYLTAAVALERKTRVSILLAGEDVRGRVRYGSVSVRDVINDAPNTASLSMEAAVHPAYRDAVLVDAPVAYWRLGDTTATALDQTGRLHTGTVLGGVTINHPGATADGDRAMSFPGTVGARIEVAAAADLALTDAVTVEAWVQTSTASQAGGIVEKTIGGNVNTSYLLFQYGATWYWRIVGPSGWSQVSIAVDGSDVGAWVHLVGVYYAGALALYKNGVQQAATAVPAGSLNGGDGVLTIGHLGVQEGGRIYPWTGLIDEVAIYETLPDARIAQHYLSALGPTAPVLAQSLRISIGLDPPVLLFNGALNQVAVTYEGRPTQTVYHCAATDDTAQANRRRPFGQWTNVSATTVAQQLIAQFVPGFGSAFVQAGLPPVSVIFDGSEGMNRCLTQITNLIGGYWYFLDRQLHLFLTEMTDPPDPIDDTPSRFLNEPPIAAATEMSQVRTRVYGRGHGENLLSAVSATETILPIADTTMFAASGGQANCLAQVLTYTGRDLGGDGSLVGPGAGPSVAPVLTLGAGAGLGSGVYQYAYTNVTAAGESLPGPLATISVGLTPPPPAPLVGAPLSGSGPDPGSHGYAITFVTASGETTPGPTTARATDVTTAPTTAPTPTVQNGASLDIGIHEYAVTFVTATGETTPSPVSSPVTTQQGVPDPTAVLTSYLSGATGGPLSAGDYSWTYTFVTAVGETAAAPLRTVAGIHAGEYAWPSVPVGPAGTIARRYYRTTANGSSLRLVFAIADNVTVNVPDTTPDSGLSTIVAPLVNTTYLAIIALAAIPIGPPLVTTRKLYRRFNGTGAYKLVAILANNTATTYTDTNPNASLGPPAPTANTASLQQFPITLPIGGSLVTARKVYRTAAGGATLQLAATIADNITTSWTDTVPDASLGAAAPGTNTATANQVALSGIAVGASPTTARKVYRTAVSGAQLKLLATLADNVTLTYLDALGDGSLGANAPTGDTSGLTQPQGQVNAGSATLPTASAGPFRSSGGWVVIGSQLIRYTGIAGNTLTGIPPSGIGALVTTVRYGDHILAAPVLTGVTVPGGLTASAGTLVTIWVQRDDAAAQAAMAARDGGDGIYEYLVQDERRAEASLVALCEAHLLAYKAPIATVTYATRDLKTKSGKPVAVDLRSPPIHGTLVIQDVTIDQIDLTPGLAPRFTVTASSVRLSLDDLLRQLAGTLEMS